MNANTYSFLQINKFQQISLLVISLFIISCGGNSTNNDNNTQKTKQDIQYNVKIIDPIPYNELIKSIPELDFYRKQLIEAMSHKYPVLFLSDAEARDSNQINAQKIALYSSDFRRDMFEQETNAPLRNEIMNVREALPSDLKNNGIAFKQKELYRVSMYNYYYNSTTIAIVNVKTESVLQVDHFSFGQPEINKRLTDIAVQIASNSREVRDALGIDPNKDQPIMPNVKTAMNGTKCERSKHLCVAPTFLNHTNKKALWAIVDLTDWKLVGIKWTDLGDFEKDPEITERTLQDDYVMENFCEKNNHVEKNNWSVYYRLTNSDGMEIIDVKYKGEKVINSAKIVDWHVNYSYKDGFGYSDAIGCPMFSSSAVIPFNGPKIEEIIKNDNEIGFTLIQDFRSPTWPQPCNYRYENRYEFYNDGSFRIKAVNKGRGCGLGGVYRPIFRIDLTASIDKGEKIEQWKDNKWTTWEKEAWTLQDSTTKYDKYNNQFRIFTSENKGYYLEPGLGQFDDGGRGDNAYTYVSVHKTEPDEGDLNMVTIGTCCNNDYQQGPEQYLIPQESIINKDIILWYVAQMYNDNTPGKEYCWATIVPEEGKAIVKDWPGTVGPLFKPFIVEK